MWCRAEDSSACQSHLPISVTVMGVTWYSVSSSQWGLIWDNAWAIRLCSLAMRVCIHVRTSCSFTRISPETFQVMQSLLPAWSFKLQLSQRKGRHPLAHCGTRLHAVHRVP
jgi:hypothetical protein